MDVTLQNSGVLCYFNALVQSLWSTESVSKFADTSCEIFTKIRNIMTTSGIQNFSDLTNLLHEKNKIFSTKKPVDPSDAHYELIKLMPDELKKKFNYTLLFEEKEKDLFNLFQLRIHDKGSKFCDIMDSLRCRMPKAKMIKFPGVLVLAVHRLTNLSVPLLASINTFLNFDEIKTYELKSVICRLGSYQSGKVFCIHKNNKKKMVIIQ